MSTQSYEEILAEIVRNSSPDEAKIRLLQDPIIANLDGISKDLEGREIDSYEILKKLIEAKLRGLPALVGVEKVFADTDDGNIRKAHIYSKIMGSAPDAFLVTVYVTGKGVFFLLESKKKKAK